MVLFIRILALIFLGINTSWASNVPYGCHYKAEDSVRRAVKLNKYDRDGYNANMCYVVFRNNTVICEVTAFKRDRNSFDIFRVTMSGSCSKALKIVKRVDL